MLKKYNIFFLVLFLTFSYIAFAQENVILEAKSVTNQDKNTTIAKGDVILLYKGVTLTADKIIYYKNSNLVEAFDNITFTDSNENYLNAKYLKIYLDNQTGIIKEAKGFYAPYHYFSAKEINKIAEKSFILKNAKLTTCKGDNPDWSFTSKHARIDYGEYFYSKSAFANIKDIPILYIPYFLWPIKEKRESGFLVPDIGYSSNKGFFITPKYFLNIDVDKDLTAGINYFAQKGFQYNLEFRYKPSLDENVYIYADYLKDKDIQFIKDERWRIFTEINKNIFDNLNLKANIDYVSDFEYLNDFQEYSLNNFIQQNDDNKFKADARLVYNTKYSNISFILRDDMQFYDITDGYQKEHIYRKPQIIFEKNSLNLNLLKIDYYFDYNDIRYTSFINTIQNNYYQSIKQYKREHLKIKLYKPINIKIATFTPSYTQYFTRWHDFNYQFSDIDDNENSLLKLSANSDSINRNFYNISLKLELNEIYKNYKNFKHSIYNSFEFSQTPYLDQTATPDLIEYDRISEENYYKYTQTNYFKAASWSLKLEFSQKYNLAKTDSRFEPLTYLLDYKYKKSIEQTFSYYKKADFDYYEKEPFYNKDQIKLTINKFYLSIEYIFDKNITTEENTSWTNTIGYSTKKIDLSFSLKKSGINSKLKYFNNSLSTNEMVTTLIYNKDCWSIGVKYTRKSITDISNSNISDKYENIFYIIIGLKGLGNTSREIYKK
ncbi:organic solvent tolerance protein [Deferribacter desulfuricans SSM1]|uniref:Organic solvent tolerance protein n=1 Tax=Deferribacter desulfuricans (strain DSM 14783 / JCM 11476 / NBRC 101012 / SSM1) TaxID=639282 RepID=D3PBT6_DEFDS|nr:OstA-like protein [Deferribacter desulfuricans]BAI80059.1 organic solvent tolerance protein [Deferribacter desulfuricans SSM1]